MEMIEFKATYYPDTGTHATSVLVQFDGVLLHVWHLSEPFYRLLSSDVFRLPVRLVGRRRYIKLPNGGRIETDDLDALAKIRTFDSLLTKGPVLTYLSSTRMLALGCSLLILFVVLFFANHYFVE